jgi:hypothetical protein
VRIENLAHLKGINLNGIQRRFSPGYCRLRSPFRAPNARLEINIGANKRNLTCTRNLITRSKHYIDGAKYKRCS